MTLDLITSITRILNANGDTVGTGFIVTKDGLIATCAHVVEAAEAGPGDSVDIVFHTSGEVRHVIVEPTWWRPPDAEDVAILHLKEPLPEGVEPLSLGSSGGTSGHSFKTFGFPDVSPEEGVWGDGHILEATKLQGVQVLQLSSPQITPGFSGAPVLDTVTRRVVGMVTAIIETDTHDRLGETAFITPSEVLRETCPELQLSDLCPYRGLAAFTEADAEFFFGREVLVTDLVAHLRSNPRFLAVVGPSGSGKSSVVQAGLFPALRRGEVPGSEAWHRVTFRPGADPFAALNAAGLAVTSAIDLQPAVRAYLRRHPRAGRLVLFADQFEELFALCPEPVQEQFTQHLFAVLECDLPVTVMLTLRADFYGYLLRHVPFVEWLKVGQVNVPPMGVIELRAAIEKPAEAVGLRFESSLGEAIVEEAGQVEHALPLLEAALTRLWARREEGVLTHAAYQAVGQVARAVGQWAEDTYGGLNEEEKQLAQRVFTRLVQFSEGEAADTRRQCTLAELVTRPGEQVTVHRLVQKLADARLLVTDRDLGTGEETVEVIHDALLREWGRLWHWLIEQRELYLWRQRLDERLREWEEKERDERLLLRDPSLAEAEHWLAERFEDLNQAEQGFIQHSIGSRDREHAARERSRNLTIVITAAVAVAMTILGAFSLKNAFESRRQSRISLVQSLVGLAPRLVETSNDDELATLLTIEALHLNREVGGNAQALIDDALRGILSAPYFSTALSGHDDIVWSVAFSPDGGTLASGSGDGTIRLWDLRTLATQPRILSGYDGNVTSVAFSPNGQTLASGGADGTIWLWDLRDLKAPLHSLHGHSGGINSTTFSPDGGTLASGSEDGTIRLWDLHNPAAEPRILRGHDNSVNSVVFSPDAQTLISASGDNTIRLWNLNVPKAPPRIFHGGDLFIWSVALSPDGRILASGNADGTIQLWNLRSLEVSTRLLRGHGISVQSMAFSPDGELLASASGDNTIRLWDLQNPDAPPYVLRGHKWGVASVAFSPDGQILASGSWDKTIRLWDLRTPEALPRLLPGHDEGVWSVAFDPHGRSLASGSVDNTIRLWNLGDLEAPSRLLSEHNGIVLSVAFSPDGQTLASGSDDSTIRLWNLLDLESPPRLLRGHESVVTSVAFSPDGKTLASGSDDSTIRLWNLLDLESPSRLLRGHESVVTSVAFSPDGKTLASGSLDNTIRLWNLGDPDASPQLLRGHSNGIEAVTFSSDGHTLASGSRDTTIRLWDLSGSGVPPRILRGHYDGVWSVAFSPDSQFLASGSRDTTIRLWIASDALVDLACRKLRRNLTQAEWEQYLPGESYRQTCSNLPPNDQN